MFGGYRFVLAVLVALSHFGVRGAGFNPGQWAVVSFYVLSGLLMERQFNKLASVGNGTRGFYLDRFLRIYPLYFVVLVLACIGKEVSTGGLISNFTLLPLDYASFTRQPVLILPAWSLACEAHFYLAVPLLVLCSTKSLRFVLSASLLLFAISPSLPNSTFWGYFGLPGVLFTFATGMLINRKDFFFLKILWAIMAILLLGFGATKVFHTTLLTGIHINVAIGYLIALIMVPWLDQFSPKKKWDRVLGLFSYPLFLCHMVVFEFVHAHWASANPQVLLLAAIAFSAVLILVVELPFDRFRYKVRGVPSAKSASNASVSSPVN